MEKYDTQKASLLAEAEMIMHYAVSKLCMDGFVTPAALFLDDNNNPSYFRVDLSDIEDQKKLLQAGALALGATKAIVVAPMSLFATHTAIQVYGEEGSYRFVIVQDYRKAGDAITLGPRYYTLPDKAVMSGIIPDKAAMKELREFIQKDKD